MSKRQLKDLDWPPLGVRDLKPDQSVTPESVRFPTLRDALERARKERP